MTQVRIIRSLTVVAGKPSVKYYDAGSEVAVVEVLVHEVAVRFTVAEFEYVCAEVARLKALDR